MKIGISLSMDEIDLDFFIMEKAQDPELDLNNLTTEEKLDLLETLLQKDINDFLLYINTRAAELEYKQKNKEFIKTKLQEVQIRIDQAMGAENEVT